jgi:hypothetical protein
VKQVVATKDETKAAFAKRWRARLASPDISQLSPVRLHRHDHAQLASPSGRRSSAGVTPPPGLRRRAIIKLPQPAKAFGDAGPPHLQRNPDGCTLTFDILGMGRMLTVRHLSSAPPLLVNARMYSVSPATAEAWLSLLEWVLRQTRLPWSVIDHPAPKSLTDL